MTDHRTGCRRVRSAAACLAGLLLLQTSVISAAVPKVDLLTPAGGTRGTTVTATMTIAGDPGPLQAWCSRPELQVKPLEEKGKLGITIPADSPPGVAWIRLYNAEGASKLLPFVIGTLPEVVEAEPNNELSQAQVLPGASVVVQGAHQAGNDVDVYAVTLKAGQTIVADLNAHRTLGSPADPVLQLVSAKGFVLEQNDDDQDLDPRIAYTVPADGTYYVRTFAFPAATDSNINFSGGASWIYRLTITTDKFVHHVLPLAVMRGVPGEFVAFGWNLGADYIKAPYAALEGENVEFMVPESGNFVTVPVVPYPVVIENKPNSQAEPQAVPTPVDISGVILTANDADFYKFPAKKGQPLVIKVLARSQGSLIDPVVSVLSTDGKQLQRIDDQGENRDPELTWNPPADGDYLVTVSDLHNRHGARYFYRISIAPPQVDYQLTVAGDNFVLPVDKPLEIPVTIDRKGGFKDEIEISLQGLPEGVTAAAVKSAGEGDTAKSVKLVVNGNPAAFSGPVQIVGTSAAEPKLTRKGRFVMTDYHTFTESIWLTVIKK